MENSNNKQPPKNLFLKFLPKAASAVSFQNPQYSPGRDHHHHNHHHSSKLKAHAHKGFSGPINFSVLPDEARGKPKNDGSYEAHEPTSPKVSCMGQIKNKHKKIKKLRKIVSNKKNNNIACNDSSCAIKSEEVNNKKSSSSSISKFFTKKSSSSKGSSDNKKDHGKNDRITTLDHKINAPSLGKMNKFASGRESLANFDWTAQIAPYDHDRDYYSDDEERRRNHSDEDEDGDDDDEEVIIPYSAPILMVGGRSSLSRDGDDDNHQDLEPRKEVNLWKRRTMAPPPPLALNSKVRS
ncbi:hypothetical protein RDABS01_011212 [Bienertia sinuspersici]